MAQETPTKETTLEELGSGEPTSQPVVLFPGGSLVLRLHSSSRHECQSLLVSGEVLTAASEVFKDRITKLVSRVPMDLSSRYCYMEMYEPQTDSLACIVQHLHHEDNLLPEPNDFQSTAKAAVYAQRYKCEKATRSWFLLLLDRMRPDVQDAACIGLELLVLCIIGGRDAEKRLTERTRRATKLLDSSFRDVWSKTSPLEALPPLLKGIVSDMSAAEFGLTDFKLDQIAEGQDVLRNQIEMAVCNGYDLLSSQARCFEQRGSQCRSCGRQFDGCVLQCTGCASDTQDLQCSGPSRQSEFISTLRSQGVLNGLSLKHIPVSDLLWRIRASAEHTLHWCSGLNECPLKKELHILWETCKDIGN